MLEHESQRSASRAAGEGIATGDMVAQFAYCPRRFHLLYLEGRWEDNAFTQDGRRVHRRVDEREEPLPDPGGHPERPVVARSVELFDEELGLRARLDLTESAAEENTPAYARPVETKRGRAPDVEGGAWEADQVQVAAQGLLLRAHGFRCDEGVVYYAGSKKRISVPFTAELEARTRAIVSEVRTRLEVAGAPLPAPLEDSRRCPGCSVVGICLPHETIALESTDGPEFKDGEIPRLFPARDDRRPLYVQEQGAWIGKRGEQLYVTKEGESLAQARLKDISQLVLCGSVNVSAALLHLLCEGGIPTVHLSHGHWLQGITTGITIRNAFDRAAQFAKAADPGACRGLAQELVAAKISNQRTMLRRNGTELDSYDLTELAMLMDRARKTEDLATLLGVEGRAAAIYFRNFSKMLRPPGDPAEDRVLDFDFGCRNRRPPRDPVNALLSFGYAMLAKECTIALLAVGLDPYWGFYHQPRHGRPALALDLMEEFRPLLVDSAVISAINTGMISLDHFVLTGAGCALTPAGRRAFIRGYEGRLDQLVTHPIFEYRCSWRRIVWLQAQLLARFLRGDVARYQGITTR